MKKNKPLPKGRTRAKSLEKRVKDEGVELGHPQGKERFDATIKKAARPTDKHKG